MQEPTPRGDHPARPWEVGGSTPEMYERKYWQDSLLLSRAPRVIHVAKEDGGKPRLHPLFQGGINSRS